RSHPARLRLALIPRLCWLSRLRRFTAIWRSTLKVCAPLSLRIRLASSAKDTSRTQCNLFSTPQCCRTASLNRTPSAGRETREYRLFIPASSPGLPRASPHATPCKLTHPALPPTQSQHLE